jgi:hypothetical protein
MKQNPTPDNAAMQAAGAVALTVTADITRIEGVEMTADAMDDVAYVIRAALTAAPAEAERAASNANAEAVRCQGIAASLADEFAVTKCDLATALQRVKALEAELAACQRGQEQMHQWYLALESENAVLTSKLDSLAKLTLKPKPQGPTP